MEVAPQGATIATGKDKDLPLVVLLAAYLEHATAHYRTPDGESTSQLREVKIVIKALRELYGEEPAAEFGPLKLKAVRQGWVTGGVSRGEANRRTNIARRIFKWAVAEELVSPTVYQ